MSIGKLFALIFESIGKTFIKKINKTKLENNKTLTSSCINNIWGSFLEVAHLSKTEYL